MQPPSRGTGSAAGSSQDGGARRGAAAPPPLPPKPSFARAAAVPAPPPLPPKPAAARAPKVADAGARPARPPPLPPPLQAQHAGAASLATSESQPARHRRMPSLSTREDATLPTTSSSSVPVLAESVDVRITLPFPPPGRVLREAGLSRLFERARADSRDLSEKEVKVAVAGMVPRTSTQAAAAGANAIGVGRAAGAPEREDGALCAERGAPYPDGPVLCRWYPGGQAGPAVWEVVDRVLELEVEAPEWDRAMEVLLGLVVNEVLDDFMAGLELCTEVLQRFREAPPGKFVLVFDFLVNLGVQATFAGPRWREVERLALIAFSSVVEEMDGAGGGDVRDGRKRDSAQADASAMSLFCITESSASDMAEVWNCAINCGVALLGGGSRFGNMAVALAQATGHAKACGGVRKALLDWTPGRRSHLNGPAISLRALFALARRIARDAHPVVDQVLIGEGMWRALRGPFDEEDDVIRCNVVESRVFSVTGGVDGVVQLYVQSRSLLARRRMFALLVEVAVARVRRSAPKALELATADMNGVANGQKEPVVSDDQVHWLFGLLLSNDMGDALVPEFRSGLSPDFVMETLRHLLFDPITSPMAPEPSPRPSPGLAASRSVPARPHDRLVNGVFLRLAPEGMNGSHGRQASSSDHRRAVVSANRILDKRFALRVLMELQSMAKSFAKRRSKTSGHQFHCAAVDSMFAAVIALRRRGRSGALRSTRTVWESLHFACMPYLSSTDPLPQRDVVCVIVELLLSVVLLPLPFTPVHSGNADSEAEAFLTSERRLLGKSSCIESADLLVTLLHLSASYGTSRYVSELRQALLEVLGSTPSHSHRALQFVNDGDGLVAFRARAIAPEWQVAIGGGSDPIIGSI